MTESHVLIIDGFFFLLPRSARHGNRKRDTFAANHTKRSTIHHVTIRYAFARTVDTLRRKTTCHHHLLAVGVRIHPVMTRLRRDVVGFEFAAIETHCIHGRSG